MAAVAIATTKANSAIFLYYGLFMFTNIGAFTMLWVSRHKDKVHHARFDHHMRSLQVDTHYAYWVQCMGSI